MKSDLLKLVTSIRDIITGSFCMIQIVYTESLCDLSVKKVAMSNWDAHLCTASPMSIAYPKKSQKLKCEEFIVEEITILQTSDLS